MSSKVSSEPGPIRVAASSTLKVADHAVNNTEFLEKIVKIIERTLRGLQIAFGSLSKATLAFGEQLASSAIMFDTLKLVGCVKSIFCPDEKGKYFLTDPANSWRKRAEKVTLALHCTFKTVKGVNKFGFVSLGVMAKNVIGKLPIFTLVMDSFMIVSSAFGGWEAVASGLPKAKKKISETTNKLEKWEKRKLDIEQLYASNPETLEHFKKKYEGKIVKLTAQQKELEAEILTNTNLINGVTFGLASMSSGRQKLQDETVMRLAAQKTLTAKLEKTNAKIALVTNRIEKIRIKDFKGLAEDLETKDIDFKKNKWNVCKYNAKQEKTKVWLKIAGAISKIAVISLALVLVATNMWAAPFALSLIVLGDITDSIGLTKLTADAFWKPKALPQPIPVTVHSSSPAA